MRYLPFLLARVCAFTSIAADADPGAGELGSPVVHLQLRYEYSDFDDAADRGTAAGLTLRARCGHQFNTWKNLSGKVVGQTAANLVEDFRYPGGGAADHDIIADPPGSRLHEG